jgi:hypothetical protein
MQAATALAPKESVRPATMSMKGIGFTNVRQYVLTKHGARGFQAVLDLLAPDDQLKMQTVLPVGWYDVSLFGRLLRAIDKTFGTGDLSLLRDVGAFEAEQDFNRVLRVFLRVMTPGSIFRAEGHIWKHFQDSGKWRSEPIDNGMRATLSGWSEDPALCEELSGYLVRLVQFTGGKKVTVTHELCRGHGHDACVFVYRWA